MIPSQITVTALSPASNLTLRETEAEWQRGLNDIRRDGARPREVRMHLAPPRCLHNPARRQSMAP
jgi:hypothetical protein